MEYLRQQLLAEATQKYKTFLISENPKIFFGDLELVSFLND